MESKSEDILETCLLSYLCMPNNPWKKLIEKDKKKKIYDISLENVIDRLHLPRVGSNL